LVCCRHGYGKIHTGVVQFPFSPSIKQLSVQREKTESEGLKVKQGVADSAVYLACRYANIEEICRSSTMEAKRRVELQIRL